MWTPIEVSSMASIPSSVFPFVASVFQAVFSFPCPLSPLPSVLAAF
jgi:hypothetical protein